jgi:hypothetical protein
VEQITRAAEQETRLAAVVTPSSGSGLSGWGRFPPGTVLAARFRIVAPLGRGGMGEVYRADDLTLDQAVALKFLPERLVTDPIRLAQFHNEVRVARTISHRNVCRMYDISQADGRPFLTMEYVDGEDLSSLLRRIGRVPQDKAIEIARQICAGLAAAHERGVLHRDLKPSNVMIDGEGHVRIADFGLAAVAGTADDIRAGTPAYMAPEQIAGREVTQRSDIYALGLVLFELFTGKRAFEASTLNELIAMHETGGVLTLSSHVRDVDPAIERIIQRCLEKSPADRPASPLVVSAALPGGDPLAAALAAGETPSPEMVAAAGEQSALRPAVGMALVAFTMVMLAGLTAISERFSVMNRIPLPRSTDSLKDRAQEIVERLGYADPPVDTAYGWELSREYLSWARERSVSDPRAALGSDRTQTAVFWYRTSPDVLLPSYNNNQPTQTDPALVLSDMRLVHLDAHGRLVEFHAIPPQVDAPSAAEAVVDWTALFDAAGLNISTFREVPSQWLPRGDADVRRAWEGPLPGIPGITMRVEAAGYHGRPTFFDAVPPWTRPRRTVPPAPSTTSQLITSAAVITGLALLSLSALLTRRHLRSGRADRRGAFRTAAVLFVCLAAGFLLRTRVFASPAIMWDRVGIVTAISLYVAAMIWVLYIALEPYVRRFWPQLLIGWTRLLSGHWRDPLVGRDVLVGVAAGVVAGLLIASRELVPWILGLPLATPGMPAPLILLETRHTVALALQTVRRALIDAMQIVGVVVFLRIVVKRTWIVLLLSGLIIVPTAISGTFAVEQLAVELAIVAAGIALMLAVLLRFGLLSLVVTFYTFLSIENFPLTIDLSRPYAGASFVLLAAVAGLSIWGFVASRGNEPLFGRPLLE